MKNRLALLLVALASLSTAHAATDAYRHWAVSKWGVTIASSDTARPTTWGENADPDRDGIPNLVEYHADTNPTARTPLSDVYTYSVPDSGSPSSRFPQLLAWLRTDDPDLRVICQTSSDLSFWQPAAPADLSQPQPANPFIAQQDTGLVNRGLRQVRFTDMQSLANRTRAFMRLLVIRRDQIAVGPGIEPISFTSQPSVPVGSTARSNTIVLSGFTGTITINIPSGITLFVNGIAQTGTTALVKAGDTLWMQATAPGTVGVPSNYTLTIGGQSATWTFATAAIAAVPDHPGTDSGYTPVETGVSDTGAAQISIPIVVSPGTAGIQPKLSINYSSQGGNGPLGVGFSLSGLSTISRVGRTVAQDGVKGGVNFDANDRFALDGQRLIAINGADGADGTEYRLEFDPTSRIRSYGTEGSGPQRWVVETKAGLKMEFGSVTNGRVFAPLATGVGYVRNDVYTGISGTTVGSLTSAPKYPNSPDKTRYMPSMTGTFVGDNYGQRLRGFVTPKTTGAYRFSISSDDGGQLWLNPNGTAESGAILIDTGGGSSAPYTLTAGTPYFIQALHKQGTGSSFVQVYWTGPGVASGTVLAGDVLSTEDLLQPPLSASALTWALNVITDSNGNTIQVFYDDVARQRGELLVNRIAYTTNTVAGLTAGQEVVFEYEDRPDQRSRFIAGYDTKLAKRLTAVESRAKDGAAWVAVRRLAFNYRTSVRSGMTLLDSVQETAGITVLPPTSFTWNDDALPSFTKFKSPHPASSVVNMSYAQVGDFDANGAAEILSVGDDGLVTILTRTPTDFITTRWTPPPGNSFDRSILYTGDFNGDGRSDFLSRPPGDASNFRIFMSNGDGTFQPYYVPNAVAWDNATVRLGDFNGDGRTDFIAYRSLGGANWRLFFSNGDGTFTVHERTYPTFTTDGSLLTGDFNGDGLTDVVTRRGTAAWIVYASDSFGNLQEMEFPFDATFAGAADPPTVGDFNGDGIYDVLLHQNDKLIAFLFDGRSSTRAVVSAVDSAINWEPQLAGDFNGDGLTDVLGHHAGEIVRFICAGDGRMDTVREPTSVFWSQGFAQLGDFDGDGLTDLTSVWDSPQREFSRFESRSHQADLLTKVESGHGGYSTFAYKPMTDPTIHTKGPGRVYPCNDIAAAIYLVSSITSRNGIDGNGFSAPPPTPVGENSVTYRYEGAWTCQNGRGFQGFTVTESTDLTSQIVTRTEYEGVNPLIGSRVKHTEQRLLTAPVGGSALISESDTTWNITTTTNAGHPNTYFVTEASSTSKAYEVNKPAVSALVKTATRNGFSYDGYGNLLTSTTTTSGAETFTETVTNTYADAPTPTQWFLGRLETSSVTKTAPNPAGGGNISLTRASSFAYHPTTGLLTQEVIEPSGGVLRQQKDYTHDAFGNILTSTISTSGAASRTTTTTYTPDGRFVETTTNALNHTETKTYDPLLGNVLTQTGPNNLTTTWNYDAIGRPIQENRPDGTVTRSFYRRVTGSTVGAPPRAVHYVRVQSSGGAPKTVWYDLLDREIRADGIAFDGRTVSSHKVFNNRGEVTHASQPYFAGDTPLYSQMLYDAVGREYQQTDPGNRVTKTTYDGLTTTVERNYNPAAPTDFQKAVTVVNAMGWTVQSSQYLGTAAKTITRKYDPYGNLRFVTDPANNTTELRYDVRGNKTYMSEPNSGTSTFTYSGFGELKTQTNNANQTVSLSYDKLGRVLTRTEPEGVTTFEYDTAAKGIGQLARESSGDFVRSYFYDHLSRPVSTVESHGFHSFAVSRSYDGYGRPDAMTYPTGLDTRQVYTANGHLSEVQNAATTLLYWRALAVNARGQITQEVQGNGVVTDRAFDAYSGLIDGITSTFGEAGDVQKAEFDFDLIGNLTARRDKRYTTTFSETFGYDTLNRLQTVSTTGAAAVTAAYNDLGNITSRTDVGSFSYGAASTGPHALTGVTGGAFNKSCGYDAKGNRTTDGATSLTYSSFNKPVRTVKGGDTLRFDYGPDRALYRQTTFLTQPGGATSQTVREYIGGLYERETTSEGLVRHIHYIAGGSGVAAILTDERSAASPPLRLRYIHKDHLGSVDVITDSAGAVVERQSFDAWGRRRTVAYNSGTSSWSVTYPATPGSAETHRGFTGHEMLDAVGLVHMGGRIYDPITARFLSPDPFVQSPDNLQNLNRYSYVLNNPLSFTDPSGFFFKGIGKFFKKHWKTIVAVGIGIWTGGLAVSAFGFTSATASAFAYGAGAGFGSAFSGTLLAGGSVGDALRAGLRAAPTGAVTEGLLHGVDVALPDWLSSKSVPDWKAKEWFTANRVAEQVARIGSRAVIRGASSEVSGGSFSRGAMWSVVPDVARFGVNLTVEYEFRDQVLRDPVSVWKATGGDPNGELQNRGFKFFMGKGGKSDEHGIRPPEDDNNAISSYKWNQAGRSFTEAASKSGGFSGEDSFFMSQIAQRALLGNAHALSHDAFINIRFFNLFKIGDIDGVNEFSNVPWAIPTFTAHAGSVPTPWVARPKRR